MKRNNTEKQAQHLIISTFLGKRQSMRFTPLAFAYFEFFWKLWQPDCSMLKRAGVGLVFFQTIVLSARFTCLALEKKKQKKTIQM